MVDVRKFRKSKYLKASEIEEPITVTLNNVTVDTMRDGEEKPVAHFEQLDKGLPLNATNQDALAALAGGSYDSDRWIGITAELYVQDNVSSPNGIVSALRLRAVKPQAEPKADGETFDDNIPF